MGKKLWLFIACMFMTVGMAFAQKQITGSVVDAENGEPLVGVAVRVPGTNTGVLTDVNGKFSVSLPSGKKNLDFSFMGMKPASLTARDGMVVRLETDTKAMDELMVVAYGTQKKSSFTGSAVELKSADISGHVASSATSALVGKVAGITATQSDGGPGSSPTIRIRGIGSMSAGSAPLYIVDGAPYEYGIATINPSDIETMTVLKDASAAAIYGARGANGVIIITTKKAQMGRDPEIGFEARFGSNSRLIPQYETISNPAEYYETQYKALYNSKFYHGASSEEAYAYADAAILDKNNGGLGYQVYTVPEGEKFIGTNFKLNPKATLGYVHGDYYYTPDNWYDEAFHNSFRQEYNVSASGATERFNYYANLGYLGDGGSVNNSRYDRYTARISADYKIKKWLTFNSKMAYTRGESQSPMYGSTYGSSGNMFYICNTIAPIYPLYVRNADGTIKRENGRIIYDANQTDFSRAGTMGNAVRDNEYNVSKGQSNLFNGNWSLVAKPIDGLTLTAGLSVSSYDSRSNSLSSIFASGSSVDGAVSVSNSQQFTMNQQYLAQYETTIADDHNLQVLAGYEQYNLKSASLGGSNDHLYDPFIAEINNACGTSMKTVSSSSDMYMEEGFLARALYDYKDTYFLSGSYRRDASSCFAPGHRWGNFGSVGAAWQINNMSFMENVSWVNLLKLKVSFGVQGNDDLGYHAYADRYSTSYNEETKEYSIKLAAKGNENLTWETSKAWNTGIDFALFKHHLNGSIEFYNRATSDMLYSRTLPLSSGISASSYPDNVGSMYNRGVEINLNGVIFDTKDLKWDINLNMTHNKNKITFLDGEDLKYSNQILHEGGSIYQLYMVKYAGTDKTDGRGMYYMDVDHYFALDGAPIKKEQADKLGEGNYTKTTETTTTYDISAASKYDIGSTLAKLTGGFGTSLYYKGVDVSAQFSYSLGGRIYDGSYQQLMHNGQSTGNAMHKDLLDAWSPTNSNSNIPRLSTAAADDPGTVSPTPIDRFVTSSNFLSLNNLQVGYSLPRNVLNKIGINSLRVYFAGENLFLLTARKGLDPRYNYGMGSMTSGQGLASGGYAAMRTITAGLNLKF